MLSGLALGCGGDEEPPALTLEEYFRQLEQLNDESMRREEPIEERFFNAADIETAKEVLAEYPDLAGYLLAGLEAIEPLKEVEALHIEMVDATRAFREELEVTVERAQSAATIDELLAFDDPALTAAGQMFDRACMSLQNFAEKSEIDVELECGAE